MGTSWGRYFKESEAAESRSISRVQDLSAIVLETELKILPYGLGRSYGDSCLNSKGLLLNSRFLNRIISFDRKSGVFHAESGCSLREVLSLAIPAGFFLPVTPGTQYVTLGGALANDVHGKNHHKRGCFGSHVLEFGLVRSDSEGVLRCSPFENIDLYQATIGGMGLTGFVTDVKFQLIAGSPWIDEEIIKFGGLKEYQQLSAESDQDWEYTVSWVDCLKQTNDGPRGLFMRGNHSSSRAYNEGFRFQRSLAKVPIELPNLVLNRASIGLFNFLYYNKQLRNSVARTVSYGPFFYPLDILEDWNKIYGKRGFFQVQFVVPFSESLILKEIFAKIAKSGDASFLAVLKNFGNSPSVGLMSFPQPGVTLALDFANKGAPSLKLISEIYAMVLSAGGRVYPAKDAAMSAEVFLATYSKLSEFSKWVDPKFSSDFWRRVTSV